MHKLHEHDSPVVEYEAFYSIPHMFKLLLQKHPASLIAGHSSFVFVHGLFGHHERTWTWEASGPGKWSDAADKEKPSWSRSWKGTASTDVSIETKQNTPQASVYWPKALLPTAVPQARIFSWGNDVDIDHIFTSASQSSIYDHARQLASDLASEREDHEKVLF